MAEKLLENLGALKVHRKVETTPREDSDITPAFSRGQEDDSSECVERNGVVIAIVIVLRVRR